MVTKKDAGEGTSHRFTIDRNIAPAEITRSLKKYGPLARLFGRRKRPLISDTQDLKECVQHLSDPTLTTPNEKC